MDYATHFITMADACRMLNINQPQMHTVIRHGKLEGVNIAGRTHLYRSEVEAYVAKNLPKPTVLSGSGWLSPQAREQQTQRDRL